MIPYGIYVLMADNGKGNIGVATVIWVTQRSCAPPLVIVGIKADCAHTKPMEGRPDAAIMEMKDLGDTVCYGG